MAAPQITLAFDLIAQIADRDGAAPINALEGCWEKDIGGEWWIAVNAHGEPTECSRGGKVPPYRALIEHDGFPVAILHPCEGLVMAGCEDPLIEALQKHLES